MHHLETFWTKGCVFDYFNARNFSESGQFAATHILFRNDIRSRTFTKLWSEIAENNLHLITDEPSTTANFPEFKEHRHDQSLFSLLLKSRFFNGVYVLPDECWAENFNTIILNPIWATRNKYR